MFTPFTKNERPTMDAFNQKFAAILDATWSEQGITEEAVVGRGERYFAKALCGSADAYGGSVLTCTDDAAVLDGTAIGGNCIQNGTPTHDVPVAVQSVSGPIKLRIAGKNLLTLETATKSGTAYGVSWAIADGKITLSGTCDRAGGCAFIMPMEGGTAKALYFPAGNYFLSGLQEDHADQKVRLYINAYKADGTSLCTFGTSDRAGTAFALTEGAWLTVNVRITDSTVVDGIVITPQIERGSIKTSYEAYCGRTYSVPLVGTDGQALDPLRMVYAGTTTTKSPYADRLTRRSDGKWVVERNTASRVLTDAAWSKSSNYMTPSLNGATIKPGVVTHWALCSHFVSRGSSSTGAQAAGVWIGTTLVVGNDVLPNGAETTAAEMVDFCAAQATAGTPVKVYYPVATPTYEVLSDAAQNVLNTVRTNLGDNMVCCDNAPQAKVTMKYAKNLNLVVDKLSAAIVAIGGTI